MWRNKHRIGKENKKYKWSYDHSSGFYVGFKLILTINQDFEKLIANWENFKLIRSGIEDLFNITKNSLGMKQIHQYTKLSVEKKVARIVFLSQKLIYLFDEQNIEIKSIPIT